MLKTPYKEECNWGIMADLQIEGSASEDELEDICNSRMRSQIGCK